MDERYPDIIICGSADNISAILCTLSLLFSFPLILLGPSTYYAFFAAFLPLFFSSIPPLFLQKEKTQRRSGLLPLFCLWVLSMTPGTSNNIVFRFLLQVQEQSRLALLLVLSHSLPTILRSSTGSLLPPHLRIRPLRQPIQTVKNHYHQTPQIQMATIQSDLIRIWVPANALGE